MLRGFEVRFHGRGGQGVVTAARLLVEAAFIEGKWGQSIPMFGAERRGAPVLAFARISSSPIRRHSQIYEPDAVVVLDSKILSLVDVTSGLKPNGLILINSRKSPSEFHFDSFRVGVVDATGIAVDLGLYFAGFPAVNTAMIGALSRVSDIVSINSIVQAIRHDFSGTLAEKNARAASLAYDSVSFLEGGL
ncbi:MAG: 2-oxoacid:acceptor oxidoreductase family protein [archaeon GB-1867-035]|nr:2-oxoacid:acceptor oxidoreductase family protein [Candidatus Culexmicrobium profundum]